jgi:hypothetical protein
MPTIKKVLITAFGDEDQLAIDTGQSMSAAHVKLWASAPER